MRKDTTIKYLKRHLKNQYDDIEVYRQTSLKLNIPFHTDTILYIDDYDENTEFIDYELMNEKEYNRSINANCNYYADFEELYSDKNAKVLCILIK